MMGDRPFVLGATDAGRAKWVQSLAGTLGVEPAFVYKRRDAESGSRRHHRHQRRRAGARGRDLRRHDPHRAPRCSRPGRAYLAAGATAVHAVASHLVLPPGSLEKLRGAGVFQSILGTDSHPGSQQLAGVPGAITPVAERMVRALERA